MSGLYTCLHGFRSVRTDFAERPWCCWVCDECPIDLINGCDAGNPSKSLLIKRTGLLIKLQEHLIRIQTKMCSVNTYQHIPGFTSLMHLWTMNYNLLYNEEWLQVWHISLPSQRRMGWKKRWEENREWERQRNPVCG